MLYRKLVIANDGPDGPRTALVTSVSVSVAGPPGAEALARFVRPTALCSRRISRIADRLLELAACPVLVVK